MSLSPTSTASLFSMFSVLLGGFLAVFGGLMGQLLTHRLSKSRDRSQRIRDHLENLVRAIYTHEQWLLDKHQKLVIHQVTGYDIPPPIDEVRMIVALHFPVLRPEFAGLLKSHGDINNYIHDQQMARVADETVFFANWNSDRFYELYTAYLDSSSKLIDKCRDLLAAVE